MIWRLAWRNLWRNPRRTLLTVAIIALVLSLLMWLVSYMEGMSEKLQDQLARSSIGHLQVHHPQYRSQRQVDMLIPDAGLAVKTISELPGVVAVRPRLSVTASIRSSMSSTVRMVPLLGVQRDREIGASDIPDRVSEGEYVVPPPEALAEDAPLRYRNRRGITLGDKLAELLNVEIGSKVRLDMAGISEATCSAAWYVTGIVNTGSDTRDQSIAIVDLTGLQTVLGATGQVHEISVLLEDSNHTGSAVETIKEKLADVRVPLRQLELSWVDRLTGSGDGVAAAEDGLAIEAWWEVSPEIKTMLGMMDMASGFSYGLMLILMSSGILTTMFTVVYERKREIGVQSALGTPPWRVFAGSMAEAAWLALIAVIIGSALGTVWAWLMTKYGIDLSGMSGTVDAGGIYMDKLQGKMSVRVFTEPAMVVFFATLVFALFPSLRMARLKPMEAMADKG